MPSFFFLPFFFCHKDFSTINFAFIVVYIHKAGWSLFNFCRNRESVTNMLLFLVRICRESTDLQSHFWSFKALMKLNISYPCFWKTLENITHNCKTTESILQLFLLFCFALKLQKSWLLMTKRERLASVSQIITLPDIYLKIKYSTIIDNAVSSNCEKSAYSVYLHHSLPS